MLKRITLATIFLAALIPAGGLLAGGARPLAALAAGMGGLWLAGCLRGWEGLGSWLLVGFIVLAALGMAAAGGWIWAPPGVVLALAAWDLQRFTGRAAASGFDDAAREVAAREVAARDLGRRHLGRLLAVSGLGLALSWLAAGVAAGPAGGLRLPLSFGAALALGFLAVLGLSQVIRALAHESD